MSYEITLVYGGCGCIHTWQVELPPPPDDVTHRIAEPCVPEHCQSCIARGRQCPDRESARLYSAVEFVEMLPVARLTTRRRARG